MERRKIVYMNGGFQLLKPNENGGWYRYGERKSPKSINDLIGRQRYDFSIEVGAIEVLNSYRAKKGLLGIRAEEGKLVPIVEQK